MEIGGARLGKVAPPALKIVAPVGPRFAVTASASPQRAARAVQWIAAVVQRIDR